MMIEAVNSVLVNASLLRDSAEQTGFRARSSSAGVEEVRDAPAAPYVSPYISVDVNYNKAVLQIRDSDTGDVLTQFPTESTLRARQSEEALRSAEDVGERERTEAFQESGQTFEESSASPASQVSQTPVGLFAVTQSVPGTAEAQIAAAALAAGAQSGQHPVASGGVSVTA